MLLDEAGNAKVADFGTVREGVVEQGGAGSAEHTHASTKVIVGTHVYMAPEYRTHGHVSEKLDSYAFGVVLLELLTGKLPIEVAALHMEEPDLYAQMQEHTDARAGAWPAAVVGGLAAVTERCIAYHAGARATVRDVLAELEELAGAGGGAPVRADH